jgi:hypothetical protein
MALTTGFASVRSALALQDAIPEPSEDGVGLLLVCLVDVGRVRQSPVSCILLLFFTSSSNHACSLHPAEQCHYESRMCGLHSRMCALHRLHFWTCCRPLQRSLLRLHQAPAPTQSTSPPPRRSAASTRLYSFAHARFDAFSNTHALHARSLLQRVSSFRLRPPACRFTWCITIQFLCFRIQLTA